MASGIRPWCAKAKYPDLKEFLVGTVVMPVDARYDEIEAALKAHAEKFLPTGFSIVEPVCGAIFFKGATDNG